MTADELKAKIAEVDQALQQVVQALMQQNPQANRLQGQRDVYAEMLSALEALPEEKPCSDSSQKPSALSAGELKRPGTSGASSKK